MKKIKISQDTKETLIGMGLAFLFLIPFSIGLGKALEHERNNPDIIKELSLEKYRNPSTCSYCPKTK